MEIQSKKLKARRIELGLSQEALARALHCDRSYISRIERSIITPPWGFISKMAQVLTMSIAELWPYADMPVAFNGRVLDRCLELWNDGRWAEAQTLAAAIWWDMVKIGNEAFVEAVRPVLLSRATSDPDVLAIIFQDLMRGQDRSENDTVKMGLFLIRSLAQSGDLQAAQMVNIALLATPLSVENSIRLRLSQGTNLIRLGRPAQAYKSYAAAMGMADGDPKMASYAARAVHGVGASLLAIQDYVAARDYATKASAQYEHLGQQHLYYLALQNQGIASVKLGRIREGTTVLESCAEFWQPLNARRYRSVLEELG